MAYVKLFGSILASTIWSEAATTRIVWITLLALANRDGIVEGSVPGLAHLAHVSDDECRRALVSLSSPDPDSRTKDYEGRRISEATGGWLILNYEHYRDKQSAEEVKDQARLRQQRKRDRDRNAKSRLSPEITLSGSSDLTSAMDGCMDGGSLLSGEKGREATCRTRTGPIEAGPEAQRIVNNLRRPE